MPSPRLAPGDRAARRDPWSACRVEITASGGLAANGRSGGPTQEAPAATGTENRARFVPAKWPAGALSVSSRTAELRGRSREVMAGRVHMVAYCVPARGPGRTPQAAAAWRPVTTRNALRDEDHDAQLTGDDSANDECCTWVDDRRQVVTAAPSLGSSSAASVEHRSGCQHRHRAV